MRRDDFEIYYYHDAAPSDVTLHQHDFYELYCLLSGTMDYLIGGRRYTMKPGSLLLIAPGEMHRPDIEGVPQRFERIVLWMNPRFIFSLATVLPQSLRAFSDRYHGWHLITPDEKTYQVLYNLLGSLLYEKNLADADSSYLCHLTVTQLLIHLNRLLSSRPAVSGRAATRYGEIMKVYEYANGHFREDISVSALAEKFFMDKNTLTRQFKRIVGLTPGGYVRRKRLEAAHSLIRQGVSMQETAFSCGFTDYSAFYRAFRQVYGISPSEFAALSQKKEASSLNVKTDET